MEDKDIITLGISIVAVLISCFTLYLSHFRRSTKGVLTLCSHYFCQSTDENGFARELTYTFSNTGQQELFVKETSVLLGASPLGPLRHDSVYLNIDIYDKERYIVKPGQIKVFTIQYDLDFPLPPDLDRTVDKFTIVSLEVISANGSRYEVSHNISDIGPTLPGIKDKLWKGVMLGKCT